MKTLHNSDCCKRFVWAGFILYRQVRLSGHIQNSTPEISRLSLLIKWVSGISPRKNNSLFCLLFSYFPHQHTPIMQSMWNRWPVFLNSFYYQNTNMSTCEEGHIYETSSNMARWWNFGCKALRKRKLCFFFSFRKDIRCLDHDGVELSPNGFQSLLFVFAQLSQFQQGFPLSCPETSFSHKIYGIRENGKKRKKKKKKNLQCHLLLTSGSGCKSAESVISVIQQIDQNQQSSDRDGRDSQHRASLPCPQGHVDQGRCSSGTSQNCCILTSPSVSAVLKYPHSFPVK